MSRTEAATVSTVRVLRSSAQPVLLLEEELPVPWRGNSAKSSGVRQKRSSSMASRFLASVEPVLLAADAEPAALGGLARDSGSLARDPG